MEIRPVKLLECHLNLGQIHQELDFGFFHPEFVCQTEEGDVFTARMRLHITEPLDPLVIADPRCFTDGGWAANSVNSAFFDRKQSYAAQNPHQVNLPEALAGRFRFYCITAEQIRQAILQDYDYERALRLLRESGKKPRIAFTLHDPGVVGGGNTMVFRVIEWLASLGYEVTAYTCSGRYPHWARINNVKFRQFGSYEEMCAAVDEDVVVLFTMWHIEAMLDTLPRDKVILHYRQTFEARNYGFDLQSMDADKPVINLLESLPIGYFVVSPHLQDRYTRLVGKPGWLVTNGIDLRNFYPASSKSGDAVRIVSVGNPAHQNKNAGTLAEALKIVAKSHPEQKIEWHIASGDLNQFNPYGIFDKGVTLHPHTNLTPPEMRALYQSATVFVNPSLYEGFGLPTLEAMACGVPVVSADNCGLDGILENEQDCLIVPAEDAQAMAGAVARLIDEPALAAQLVQAGLSKVRKFSVASQFVQFQTAFAGILGERFPEEAAQALQVQLFQAQEGGEKASLLVRKPLVSIVIPSYNQADYLKEAFGSLIQQTYDHWEAVVVDDGSTDHTAQVIAEYEQKDARIRGFHKPNGGITSALNEGLRQARGEFFCWLSSDDLFYPQKLERQLRIFDGLGDEFAIVYGSFDLLNQGTGQVETQGIMPQITPGAEFPEAFKFDFIDGCTIMIRMQVMREVNGFNPSYRHAQDTELWMRIASHGYRFYNLPEKMTIRRIHPAQSSTGNMIHCRHDAIGMVNYFLEHFKLLEVYRYFDLSNEKRLNEFINHLAGRTFHTEAAINHPLLMEKFWSWIDSGLTVLPPDTQKIILTGLRNTFRANLGATPKVKYYLDRCDKALDQPRVQTPRALCYGASGRDIRADSRRRDPLLYALFDYGCELLVNANTPLFAQELFFHDTNKVVSGPYKLGHAAFRYLSQFDNDHQEIVRPVAGMDRIPATASDALDLFSTVRYPLLVEPLRVSTAFHLADSGTLEAAQSADRAIAAMPDYYRADLAHFVASRPTEYILYYWLQLTQDAGADYQRVVAQAKERRSRARRLDEEALLASIAKKDARYYLGKLKKYVNHPRLILPKVMDIMIHKLLAIRARLP